MITIIFAPPRTGKTCYMTHVLNEAMYDRQRTRAMQSELIGKINNGFTNIETIPPHCVSANYTITGKKFGYSPRRNRIINPYKLGFANPFVDTHFTFPYECIGITEAQKYLNSRMSIFNPDWQSRWYEQHGHNNLDIYLDTQRPMLIDPNIRELSSFVEILSLDKKHDKNGKIVSLTWHTRKIANSNLFDNYMKSGRTDKSCYESEDITAPYNVFDCYDSFSCKPKFYDGHFGADIDYETAFAVDNSIDSYIDYLKQNDDELPDKFYMKKGGKQ